MTPAEGRNSRMRSGFAAAAGLVAVVGGLLWLGASRPELAPSGAAQTNLAASSASSAPLAPDQTVRMLKGGIHTVAHSLVPLPSASAPRADGRPTLVWFSGTWCDVCASMEPYTNATLAQFDGQLAFVEKSVDHDRGAVTRYGVRGTPTFVLIDAQGKELGRFLYQPDAARLTQAVNRLLAASHS